MRFLLTVILTLMVFTTSQLASAYEMCDDPECASEWLLNHKDPVQKKSDHVSGHCTVACHHMVLLPQHVAPTARDVSSVHTVWTEAPMPESAFNESLLEPPSLA